MVDERPNGFAGAVVTLIEALLLALVASGFLQMDDATAQLWVNVGAAAVAVLTPLVGFWWTSRQTTALARPQDSDGTHLLRSDGMPTLKMQAREIKMQGKSRET